MDLLNGYLLTQSFHLTPSLINVLSHCKDKTSSNYIENTLLNNKLFTSKSS